MTTEIKTANRILRIPLAPLHKDLRNDLRELGYNCAAYGNCLLSESYAKAKGLQAEWKTYTDWNTKLASGVRDAINQECVGMWRRIGKKILSGQQTLARFSNGRAIVVRGSRVEVMNEGEQYSVLAKLWPASVKSATLFNVDMKAIRKDWYLASTLQKLGTEYKVTKATILLDKDKTYVLVAYQKPLPVATEKSATAVMGLEGTLLRIRCEGRTLSFGGNVSHILTIKENFAQIKERLGRDLRGRNKHEKYRIFAKYGTFEQWVRGPLHQLSKAVVNWAVTQNVGSLTWETSELEDSIKFPWSEFRSLIEYKCQDVGIAFAQPTTITQILKAKEEERWAERNKKKMKQFTATMGAAGESQSEPPKS